MTLPAFAAERRRLQHGAQQPLIDICCKRRRLVAAVDRWDRQTDAQSFHRHCSAYSAIGINNSVVLLKICAQQWVTVSRWLKHDVTPSTGCWPTRTQLYQYSHVGFTRHWSSDRQRNGTKKTACCKWRKLQVWAGVADETQDDVLRYRKRSLRVVREKVVASQCDEISTVNYGPMYTTHVHGPWTKVLCMHWAVSTRVHGPWT